MNHCCCREAITITYLCVHACMRVCECKCLGTLVCACMHVCECKCLGMLVCACMYARVTLLIQHAMCMRQIVSSFVASLAPPYFSELSHKQHDFRKKSY
jgi:hypothetical protein